MCMCIHYITAWSKSDHDFSFRLRLVCAPYCPDHFTIIVPSLYHPFEVSFHSPVFNYLFDFQSHGGEYIAQLFLYMPKYIKFHTLLKLPYYQVKSPYIYHGPLVIAKRECVDRSIEGDASIRVWVAPNGTNAFHVLTNWVSGKHSGGAITKSSFGVMSLRANVAFLTFLSVYYYLWLMYLRFTYKPMIIHQLYVDRFSQCISQVTKVYSHGMHGVAETTRLTLYFCTYDTFDLVELIFI
jgi:hypothetical protein